jgi:hypothetical protein
MTATHAAMSRVQRKRLPKFAVEAAEHAIIQAAADFGHDDLVAGSAREFARAALEAALPLIEKHVHREVAKEILFLDGIDRECTRNVGPYGCMDASLQRLARGEPLPYWEDVRGGSHPATGKDRSHDH